MLRIRRHLQDEEELTLRYSPGYCGMDIGQQRKLFQLVQADAVGVTLLPSMLMHPLKSISGLVGLAPKEAVSRIVRRAISVRGPDVICGDEGQDVERVHGITQLVLTSRFAYLRTRRAALDTDADRLIGRLADSEFNSLVLDRHLLARSLSFA